MSVEDLQRLYGVTRATVLKHLRAFHETVRPIDDARLLPCVEAPAAAQGDALALFAEPGAKELRPIYDALDGRVSYHDLRLLRIYYLSQFATGGQRNS